MAEGTRIVTRLAFVPPSPPHNPPSLIPHHNSTNNLPRVVLTADHKTDYTKLVLYNSYYSDTASRHIHTSLHLV